VSKAYVFEEEHAVDMVDIETMSLEDMRAVLYRRYEEIQSVIPALDKLHESYVSWCDRDRYRTGVSEGIQLSNCKQFMYYFYTHHTELTNYVTWSGSDMQELLYIFDVILVHLHALFKKLDREANEVSRRLEYLYY
jgi:hypothetical protein